MKLCENRMKRLDWRKTIVLVASALCSILPAHAAGGLYGWGENSFGFLGDKASVDSRVPVGLNLDGIPTDVSIASVVAGTQGILVLGSNGRLYSWGANESGQLGNGTNTDSPTPVAVDVSGVLAGKTIASIASGSGYCLALTADGRLYSWGRNESGNLGNGTTTNSSVPVAVDMSGALAGKTIKAVAAGGSRCMALTTDGLLYQWGLFGQGEWSPIISSVPVVVDMGAELPGKTITAIDVSTSHSLVLTADNHLYSWGKNFAGQLGNGTNTDSSTPISVDRSGALSGQTISAIAVGEAHSLVLTTAGRVCAWGYNGEGELGNGLSGYSDVPVAVDTSGVLSGKTIIAISSKIFHCVALDSDGVIYSWGYNMFGQLGDGTTALSRVPIKVYSSGVLAGKTGTKVLAGGNFSLATATGGDMTSPGVAVTTPANGAALGK